ncbi:bifunctional adenosylcobinamide kinase/adenosylcobinamide-phosphate guanylyltransferase [Tumebacillus permanentifrigoris]|uniref:Adenosylcobinamide kinase n=1 Tax=Tumebacillus permanentifrigoris TaxID=378543 RepID=A0A316DCB6_9BACL|nr:bifunctional adenosylcobinamide kinase/adenosylcobinamide-phosphate guanylyltransferase [Tumebacillus permanentifrigoris]PWK14823.1 adenosylcobinamide kinase /adenosylcobinamide-phosphate guanylyltransferase [Tumebacillus permanentifrigoris]
MPYTLVTGGVRSGKSAWAERRAGFSRRVLYVATGQIWDAEMQARIDLHRNRRPASWGLLEAGEDLTNPIADALRVDGWEVVLLDCLSTWVSTILLNLPEEAWRTDETRQRVLTEAHHLADFLQKSPVPTVLVTNETGLGGVAMTPLGRAFQDLLGEVNQLFAAQAEEVYLVVSGRPLRLPSIEGSGVE